jgi:hypothetical protein
MEVDNVVPAMPVALASAGAGIGLEDYVDDAALPHIISLLEENTCRATEKAEEWKREVMLQEEIYVDLDEDF